MIFVIDRDARSSHGLVKFNNNRNVYPFGVCVWVGHLCYRPSYHDDPGIKWGEGPCCIKRMERCGRSNHLSLDSLKDSTSSNAVSKTRRPRGNILLFGCKLYYNIILYTYNLAELFFFNFDFTNLYKNRIISVFFTKPQATMHNYANTIHLIDTEYCLVHNKMY